MDANLNTGNGAAHAGSIEQLSHSSGLSPDMAIRCPAAKTPSARVRAACSLDKRINSLADSLISSARDIGSENARFLSRLAEFDKLEGWKVLFHRSCAHWLNAYCGISLVAAREKVRVARALCDLPAINAALAMGKLSYSKVRAITRVADHENEASLINMAHLNPANQVENIVRQYRRCRDKEDLLREKDKARLLFSRRTFNAWWDDDGSMIVRGSLPPEQGALFLQSLLKADDLLFRESNVVGCDATRARPELAPAQRRADALVLMAEAHLAGGSATGKTADSSQVVVNTDLNALQAPLTVHCEQGEAQSCEQGELSSGAVKFATVAASATIENDPAIDFDTARRLTCDASLVSILTRFGEPLAIGRKGRVIPAPMRRALIYRDKCCQFPGCCATRHLDGHHIVHWAVGGTTEIDNLAVLCTLHHRVVHEDGCFILKVHELRSQYREFSDDGLALHEMHFRGSVNSVYNSEIIAQIEEAGFSHRFLFTRPDGSLFGFRSACVA